MTFAIPSAPSYVTDAARFYSFRFGPPYLLLSNCHRLCGADYISRRAFIDPTVAREQPSEQAQGPVGQIH
jgi:hypothetical protein